MQTFALQTVLKDITVKEQTMKSVTTVAEMFPQDAQVFNLGVPHYGCMGKVCSTHGGNATVLFKIPPEPNLTKIFKKMHTMSSYHPGWKIASNVGITGYLLSRITGSIYIYYPETRKWSIGLNLKFTKEKSGIAGFTKRKDNEWLYSDAVTKLLLAYKQRFPRVLQYLEESLMKTSEDSLDLEAMMGSEGIIEKLQELSKWLKSLPSYGGTKVHESSNTIEPIVVSAIDEEIQLFKNKTKDKTTEVKLSVLSHYLYRPLVQQGTLTPDKQAKHHELDRVVNVREGHTVPLGLRGTIIGIHTRGSSEQGVVFDVMFDDEFMGGLTLGGRCPPRRGYSLPIYSVINLTHGERTMNKNNRPVAVVHPHHQGAANQHTLKHGQRLVRSPQSAFTPAKKGNHPPTAVTLLQRGKPPNQRSNHKKPPNTEQASVSPSGHRGQKKTQKPGIPLNKEKQALETSLTEAAQTLPKIKMDKPEIKKTNQNTPTNRNAEEFKPTNQNAEEFKPTNQNGEEFKPTNEMTDILSTLTINDPVENINNNNGTHPKQQILPTEQSQATVTPEPSAHFNQLLATLGTTKPPHHKETSNPAHKIPPHPYNHQPNPLSPPHQPQLRLHLPPNYYHGPPKPFSLQEFLANPPNYPPPPFHPNNPTLLGPESFQPHPYPPNPTRNPVDFAKEGTDKLCEILNIRDNEEKLTTDTKCQDKWSTGPKENDSLKKEKKEKSTFQDKTESCDRGSDCDETDERSTSVEAAKTKEKSKVGELLQWCYQHHVFPPVYTFCKTNETDNISTVELWNGLKFQSLPKLTLELANEECARAALTYVVGMHSEPHPRYSAPPPSAPSYLLQDASMPQYAAVQPLPPMMSPMMSSNHMMSSIMPPAPYYQPSMVNPYLAVGPDGLLYPRYFPASQYGYSPVPHTGGVIPRYTPAFKAVHPIVHGNKGLLHHNQPGQSTSVPQQFIPPQVEHHSPPRASRSPNYYLSDSPVASSVEKVNKTEKKEQKPRKSKPTLAISFAPTKPT
uniref:5'-3' exoribonuclease 1 isoform X4 n=1 Tax=Ciona intestinalis TaxID=7719 RepID=UPI00089DB73B|nr:5'-3' exoribonuclease 1 isoform X4 [Ciona intestinalis]|eukprot:XP_018671298.1 5'-3' exoribonuclease 1 isoform X4 [Ciona intestinalis]